MTNDKLFDHEEIYKGLINTEKYNKWKDEERYKITKITRDYDEKIKELKHTNIFKAVILILIDLFDNYYTYLILSDMVNSKNTNIVFFMLMGSLLALPKVLIYKYVYIIIKSIIEDKNNLDNEKKETIENLEKEFKENDMNIRKKLFN